MTAPALLGDRTVAEWPVWTTIARVVVPDPDVLPAARALVVEHLAAVDAACSRFRADSELALLPSGRPVEVSPLLAELVGAALAAARDTAGAVDPTLGSVLADLGYDRDIDRIVPTPDAPPVVVRGPGWRRVSLQGTTLRVPAGVRLDLGATAKAFAADRCALLVAETFGTGVLVSLGGDIATAGEPPAGGWRVLVADQPDDPAATIRIPGGAIATSSTRSRTWRRGDRTLHHILDPRTARPAEPVWRSASVVADHCLGANTASTAAIVLGFDALGWLRRLGLPARLVAEGGSVHTLNGWPEETR